jgi:dipeptidyl aminopeptidase/acylaminoacyl peptidase
MGRKGVLAAAVAGFLAAGQVFAAEPAKAPPWPIAADIPTPAPVALGLAGEGVDITRYLMVRGARTPQLSPDGKTLAYLSSVSGDPQLWTVPATGGWPTQLTFGSGVDGAVWSPDGAGVIYSADAAGDEREGYYVLSPDGRSERVLLPKTDAFRRLGDFSTDGRVVYASTERSGRDFDVWVANLATGERRMAYQGRFGFYPLAWQPKGPLVVVAETRGEDAQDLHLLNIDTGKLTTLFKPKVAASHQDPAWLADGSGFYLLTNQDREFQNLAFYDLNARKLRYEITENHDVSGLALSPDDRFLAWVTDVDGYSRLDVLDRTTGRKVAAPNLPKGLYVVEFGRDVAKLMIQVHGPQSVGEVFVWDPATGALTQPVKTSWAGLDPATMSVPEAINFKARDGLTVHGLYYAPKPAPDGRKPPLLLQVHGGPTASATTDFSPDVQYFVARGIAVVDLNFRGSTGFGKTYARLNDKRLRVNELHDTADAVKWARDAGRVDPDRAAIMGGSYGGYLTNAAVGAYPDLFRAGISFVGVSDWVKALEGAGPALKASDRQEYGDIDNPEDRKFFATISPINNAAKIKTPLLVEHGANDPRDPVTESDHLVEAVRKTGTEVVYLRFPDEGHGIVNMANRVHAYRRVAAFLEEKFGMAGK